MSGLIAAVLAVAAMLTAITVYQVQSRLEEWDYERHVED